MVGGTDNRRREFLKLAALSLAGLTTASNQALGQARDTIQRPETPDRALNLMIEGNQRFVAQSLVSFHEDLDILKAHSEEHQEPFAAVLSCADSRVPVASVISLSFASPATWPLRIPLLASNTVRPCWA
jgi:carbonic anhydrase